MNQNIYIGCCGAYCRTCKAFLEDFCKGCKLGYENGERDINKVKCKIKVCCFKNMEYDSCADCAKLDSCKIIGDLYSKNGYKYKKYKEAIEFIKQNGYEDFIQLADKWNGAYGKLK